MDHLLAIVIPAYKSKFLSETLQSLSKQHNLNFHVYIGDDGSPDDLHSIVAPFLEKLSISYQRFNQNLGKESLTAHWARCISMVGDEEWIWLLPDDDVASDDCVEQFYKTMAVNGNRKFLYRFQTIHIDGKNQLLRTTKACPPLETNVEFLIRKLKYERSSSVAEYIFSKNAYTKSGGFVHLPLAWGSDDLLWIALAQEHPIHTLPGGTVYLRQSELNISANTVDYTEQKFEAKYLFLGYVLKNRLLMQRLLENYSVAEFRKLIAAHLFFEYKSYQLHFSGRNLLKYAAKNNRVIGGGLLRNIYRLLIHELRNGSKSTM
jgi:glycosyltransferase involved in cell wall biosynthesis